MSTEAVRVFREHVAGDAQDCCKTFEAALERKDLVTATWSRRDKLMKLVPHKSDRFLTHVIDPSLISPDVGVSSKSKVEGQVRRYRSLLNRDSTHFGLVSLDYILDALEYHLNKRLHSKDTVHLHPRSTCKLCAANELARALTEMLDNHLTNEVLTALRTYSKNSEAHICVYYIYVTKANSFYTTPRLRYRAVNGLQTLSGAYSLLHVFKSIVGDLYSNFDDVWNDAIYKYYSGWIYSQHLRNRSGNGQTPHYYPTLWVNIEQTMFDRGQLI